MKHFRLFAVSVLFALCACSQQGEGDTCLQSNGDSDCESGLVCVAAGDLAESTKMGEYGADRCCPKDGRSSNSHCKLKTDSEDSSGVGGQSSGEGVGGTSGTTAAAGGSGGSSTSPSSGGTSAASTDSASGGTLPGLGGATGA